MLSHPYVIAFTKHRFLDLRVAVSTATDNVDKVQFFADWADAVLRDDGDREAFTRRIERTLERFATSQFRTAGRR